MPQYNEPPGSDHIRNLSLNDKIISIAKEANRRHDDAMACFKDPLEPKDIISFKFQGVEQAALTEHLLCEMYAKLLPSKLYEINNFYKITLESTVKMSLLVIDYIEKNFNDRCKEHTSVANIECFRQELNEKMQRAEKLLIDFWVNTAVIWGELNKIHFAVFNLMEKTTSLVTLCGFRREIIPQIKNSRLHPSVIDYVAHDRLKAETSVMDTFNQVYDKYFSDKILPCSPVVRGECIVSVSFDFLFNGWLSGFCKRAAGLLDTSCRYSVTVDELDMLSRCNELLNKQSNLDRNLHTLFQVDCSHPAIAHFTKLVRDFFLAQADFCNQMHGLINCSFVEIMPPQTKTTVHVEKILSGLVSIQNEVVASRAENLVGFKSVGTDLEAVAAGNFKLRVENDELRRLAANGFLNFVRSVDPEDFCSFAFILAYGDRAKAAQVLETSPRRFYEQIASWKNRGPAYKQMYAWVQRRKTSMQKGTVPLGDQLQMGGVHDEGENPKTISAVLDQIESGNLDQRDYPEILQGILKVLADMNPGNWQVIRKEVMEGIREEIAQ